jgi:hypothetical protein
LDLGAMKRGKKEETFTSKGVERRRGKREEAKKKTENKAGGSKKSSKSVNKENKKPRQTR